MNLYLLFIILTSFSIRLIFAYLFLFLLFLRTRIGDSVGVWGSGGGAASAGLTVLWMILWWILSLITYYYILKLNNIKVTQNNISSNTYSKAISIGAGKHFLNFLLKLLHSTLPYIIIIPISDYKNWISFICLL